MSAKRAVHENPLIPNARLKQMYRALLRAHRAAQSLPRAARVPAAGSGAAVVSTLIDLGSRDVVVHASSGPVVDPLANAAQTPAMPQDSIARMWSAIGIAASLQQIAAQHRPASRDLPVEIVYTHRGEVGVDTWKAALLFAAKHNLPVIFVVLPGNIAKKRSNRFDLGTIAHRAGVPAIPVDTDDPVALYRVAQESIGHARIGAGPALIECVRFQSTAAAPASRISAVSGAALNLEQYMLQRGIVTRAWLDRQGTQSRSRKLTSK